MANARRIKYAVKGFDVTVADSFGDVLVVYVDVPALSKEDAAEMVRKRLSISAEQTTSNQMYAEKAFPIGGGDFSLNAIGLRPRDIK